MMPSQCEISRRLILKVERFNIECTFINYKGSWGKSDEDYLIVVVFSWSNLGDFFFPIPLHQCSVKNMGWFLLLIGKILLVILMFPEGSCAY